MRIRFNSASKLAETSCIIGRVASRRGVVMNHSRLCRSATFYCEVLHGTGD